MGHSGPSMMPYISSAHQMGYGSGAGMMGTSLDSHAYPSNHAAGIPGRPDPTIGLDGKQGSMPHTYKQVMHGQYGMQNQQMGKHAYMGGAPGSTEHGLRLFLLTVDQTPIEVPYEITQMCLNIKNLQQPYRQPQHLAVQTKANERIINILHEYC